MLWMIGEGRRAGKIYYEGKKYSPITTSDLRKCVMDISLITQLLHIAY